MDIVAIVSRKSTGTAVAVERLVMDMRLLLLRSTDIEQDSRFR